MIPALRNSRLLAVLLLTFYVTGASGACTDSLASVVINHMAAKFAPYPCAWHHCSCTSAEACGTSCCCFKKAPKPEVKSCCTANNTHQAGKPHTAIWIIETAPCKGESSTDSISILPLHVVQVPPPVPVQITPPTDYFVPQDSAGQYTPQLPDHVPILG